MIKMFNAKVDHPGADSLLYSSRSWILEGVGCGQDKTKYSTPPSLEE